MKNRSKPRKIDLTDLSMQFLLDAPEDDEDMQIRLERISLTFNSTIWNRVLSTKKEEKLYEIADTVCRHR